LEETDLTLVKIQKAKEELDKLHQHGKYGKKPSTIQEDGMNQFQAAKEIRVLVRQLEITPDVELQLATHALEQLLNKPQSKKAERIEAMNAVTSAQKKYRENSAKSLYRLKILAQHLPTTENLPTDKSSNAVRAFVAILKSNGILTQDGTVTL
jgi:hypothetical protein